ncbi:unnamed protein product [Closterium sp. Naga37s-1]|nr:unnamed protein product [Closterium sp. Naga37s-1]
MCAPLVGVSCVHPWWVCHVCTPGGCVMCAPLVGVSCVHPWWVCHVCTPGGCVMCAPLVGVSCVHPWWVCHVCTPGGCVMCAPLVGVSCVHPWWVCHVCTPGGCVMCAPLVGVSCVHPWWVCHVCTPGGCVDILSLARSCWTGTSPALVGRAPRPLLLDGQRLATASSKGTLIRVFNTADGMKLHEVSFAPGSGDSSAASSSPPRRPSSVVASHTCSPHCTLHQTIPSPCHPLAAPPMAGSCAGEWRVVCSLVFSPKAPFLVVACHTCSPHCTPLLTSAPSRQLRRGVERADIYSLVFSPKAPFLVAASNRGTVHVLSLSPIPSFRLPPGSPWCGGGAVSALSSFGLMKGGMRGVAWDGLRGWHGMLPRGGVLKGWGAQGVGCSRGGVLKEWGAGGNHFAVITPSPGYPSYPCVCAHACVHAHALLTPLMLPPSPASDLLLPSPLPGVLPKYLRDERSLAFYRYFSDERSLAFYRVGVHTRMLAAFGAEANTVIVVGSTGAFYKLQFDPQTGGEMRLLEAANFLATEDEQI